MQSVLAVVSGQQSNSLTFEYLDAPAVPSMSAAARVLLGALLVAPAIRRLRTIRRRPMC